VVIAGATIPMTHVRPRVLSARPIRTWCRHNNYSPAGVHGGGPGQGGRQSGRSADAEPRCSGDGFRNLDRRSPNIRYIRRAGNGHIYARNRRFVLASTWAPTGRSLLEARLGYSWTQAGKNPPSLGSDSAFDQFGLPGLPTDSRIAGGLPTQLITGYSDLGRQATNPQWQYPTVYNPKINYTWTTGAHSFKSGYEYQRISTEVQDVNPLYGRDTYNGQFTRPTGAAAGNIYNLADFMLGLRAQYALSSVLVANLRRNMQFACVQDDWRAGSRLTHPGVHMACSTSHTGRGTTSDELRSGDQHVLIRQSGSISAIARSST
jgi:hypothetical protein